MRWPSQIAAGALLALAYAVGFASGLHVPLASSPTRVPRRMTRSSPVTMKAPLPGLWKRQQPNTLGSWRVESVVDSGEPNSMFVFLFDDGSGEYSELDLWFNVSTLSRIYSSSAHRANVQCCAPAGLCARQQLTFALPKSLTRLDKRTYPFDKFTYPLYISPFRCSFTPLGSIFKSKLLVYLSRHSHSGADNDIVYTLCDARGVRDLMC